MVLLWNTIMQYLFRNLKPVHTPSVSDITPGIHSNSKFKRRIQLYAGKCSVGYYLQRVNMANNLKVQLQDKVEFGSISKRHS